MARRNSESIPYPIEYYDRLGIARSIHVLVNGHAPPSLHHMCLLVRHNGPLETMKLQRIEYSLYRSLSMWLFGNEDEHKLIHKAALKHVKSNRAYFNRIYDEEMRPGPQCLDAYDHMKSAAKDGRQASLVDVHAVVHLTGTAIYLFREDSKEFCKFLPDDNDRKRSNGAIFLAAKPTGDGYTFFYTPVVAYERRRPQKRRHSERVVDVKADRFAITLVAKDEKNTVTVPYAVASAFSPNLAEFCGEGIRTDMSLETLRRLQSFLLTGSKPGDALDHELYGFAKRWCITSLCKHMEELLQHSALTDVVSFANHISLRQDEAIYETLKRRLYRAPTAEMKHLRCNPDRRLTPN